MIRKIGNTINRNSAGILAGVGVVGVVTTTVLAVKATPLAYEILLEESRRVDDPFTLKEKFMLTWKVYIPTAAMATVTIAAIIGSQTVNQRKHTALAGLYTLSEKTFTEYQHQVMEQLGENKEKELRDSAVSKVTNETNPHSMSNVFMTGKGDHLCYETASGRYFRSDIESVRKVENDVNHRLISDMWVSLNEVYSELGLPSISIGEDLGWNVDRLLAFNFSSMITDDGEPCLVIDYDVPPSQEFR